MTIYSIGNGMREIPKFNPLAEVGRRIKYTGDMANLSGIGAIVRVTENQWGNHVDMILTDGREIRGIMAGTLAHISQEHGCAHRFLVLDDMADADELAGLMAGAAILVAQERAAKDEAAAARAVEIERIKAENPTLAQGSDPKTAAKNIRVMLKAAFPKIKFSVRAPRYDSIYVRWTDGPTRAQVEAIADRFQDGHFDGMDDCYKYGNSPWCKTFGGARYVSCDRDTSPALIQRAIDAIAERFGAESKPTPEQFKDGQTWNTYPAEPGGNDWQMLIHRELSGIPE